MTCCFAFLLPVKTAARRQSTSFSFSIALAFVSVSAITRPVFLLSQQLRRKKTQLCSMVYVKEEEEGARKSSKVSTF
ncbi:unnamed protein product [Cuscuta campestris]|uniref:Uncharacterized protein n=1 Tax=Cuscuta campestris TaxID=132261 RepID=A0A484LJ02_9ASTE|nr:unnamed protein product [Cuscuta campestris]